MNTEIYIFDLDDTLTESKSAMSPEMVAVFTQLLQKNKVAVISGCLFSQFVEQVVRLLPQDAVLSNLYLFPANGSSMYQYDGEWRQVYTESLPVQDRENIIGVINWVIAQSGIDIGQSYGPRIEDRESQITFSALGQQAPVDKKKTWDPDQKIRLPLAAKIQQLLPNFEVRVGGATSIDVTRKGMTKAYAIHKIEELLKIPKDHMLYFGDAIFPGGNDYSVHELGVPCISVKNHLDTHHHLIEILHKGN